MEKIIKTLKSLERDTLILTHHNADIDAIASALALHLGLKQLNIKSKIGVSESVSRAARKLAEKYNILINPDCSDFQTIILVDTSVPEQLSQVKNLRADIIIDHHPKGKLTKDSLNYIVKTRSAAQLIYGILENLGCKFDKELSKIIIAGIVADTGHLRLAEVEEFEIVTKLLKNVKYSDVLKEITMKSDSSEVIACLKALKRAEFFKIGDLIVGISKVISHEAAACRSFIRLGTDIGIVIAVKSKEIRISSRARNDILKHGLDLSVIFKEVGEIIGGSGGGHNLAGSANGPKVKNVDKVKNFIIREISKKTKSKIKRLD